MSDQTITIPRPHVPYGPLHVPENAADAEYLRSAVRNIDHRNGGERLWGSNVTATIRKLLLDAAEALDPTPPAPEPPKDPEWEFGFYDDEYPWTTYWSTFGGLVGFKTADDARHTAAKSVTGEAVIVRRRVGSEAIELVEANRD